LVVQKISLIEIVSTAVLLAVVVVVVVDLSRVFYAVDSATLQPVHRCTPAPYGTLAVPAALPTVALHVVQQSAWRVMCCVPAEQTGCITGEEDEEEETEGLAALREALGS